MKTAQAAAEQALKHFKYDKTQRMLIRGHTGTLQVPYAEVLVTVTVGFKLTRC